ncbi:class I SAM-dependent methyltransferase [Ectothiorhodospira mobilis]|uniref:class I SAM-dependent methyltransferase n=1 Tax=Ectothiorhodospira mobilis TaxID=195064 RepID=UPI001903C8EA|nr:class I SAM-dependent methyltransferase [Ectothiorhodospira mobilis]MBK1692644.1 phosphatidylethanolamine N-methyltransferase [Ectothiorhodospira mobilis]
MRIPYTLWAPIYDRFVEKPTQEARRNSLERLGNVEGMEILIIGVGTGLDLPHLPQGATYRGVDLTPAMLTKARERAEALGMDIDLQEADAKALPFEDGRFDVVILHNLLAACGKPEKALAEASRVTRPGGRLLIMDKFLKPGESAPLRRLLGVVTGPLASRTDLVFESLMRRHKNLKVVENSPALLRGWFRHIVLEKAVDEAAATPPRQQSGSPEEAPAPESGA